MQTSEPQTMTGRWKRQGTNLPPTNDECHHFSFNSDAPEFRPGMFQLAGYSEFIQDLAVAWDTVAFSWQDEPASARIITWFVDHRFPFPRCLHGREVTLYDDYAAWEEHIKRRWVDQLDLRYDLEMHLITPTPPRLEPEIAAHVVLIQAPRMDWVSNLVSVDDRMWHPFNAGYPTGLIITTHEHIRFEHVAQACGYDEACIWPIGNMEQSQRALCEASRSCTRWASGGENRRHSLGYGLLSAQGNQANFDWQSVDVLCNPYDGGIVLHRRLWSTRASSIAIQADFRFNLEDTVDGVVAQFT